jgi:hypothetical protein
MAIYDLYDNSARPSPQAPSSPLLQEARLELDSVLDNMAEDFKRLHPEWRKRRRGQTVPNTGEASNLGTFIEPILSAFILSKAARTSGRRLIRERYRNDRRREKRRINSPWLWERLLALQVTESYLMNGCMSDQRYAHCALLSTINDNPSLNPPRGRHVGKVQTNDRIRGTCRI